MSAYNPDIKLGSEETRTITFAAPTGIGVPVIGVDNATNETFFNLTTINSIIRAVEDQAMGATRKYEYEITRDNYKIRSLVSDFCKVEIQGPVFPGLPLNLSPGQYQIKMIQKVQGDGLEGRTLTLVWQKSLA